MDIELIIGTVLSGIICACIYKYIGENFKKLIKIIYSIFIPFGIVIWVYEIVISHSISFNQFGILYITICIIIVVSKINKLLHDYTIIRSVKTDPILLLYIWIFMLSLFVYLYVNETFLSIFD